MIPNLVRRLINYFRRRPFRSLVAAVAGEPKKLSAKALKAQRIQRNNEAVRAIYARGAKDFPAEYLICHQDADKETVARVMAEAEARRLRRNMKRLAHA